ncbi:MAG: LacI family transcriptional regulator [Actinomycetota bacterium]|nr:LacI family transcriptional regulator [Actinomycetota bacterium]
MTATSHDVANLAGVSQPTVSRALRGDPRVAEATRQRVLIAAADLGYVTSEVGRSLSTRSTRQIAMVADLRNALYPALVGPLHDRFAEHGLRMVLLAERGDDKATYDRLLDRSVDGVILTTSLIGSSLSTGLVERGLPFIELNRLSGRRKAYGVTADNRGGAADVAALLIAEGHRRIAAVFGDRHASTSRDREAGFRSALERAGIELPAARVAHGGFGYQDGEQGFAAVMSGRHRPTAIFCFGDLVAIGAINQARRMGLSVPSDVAIVGFDDIDMAAWPCFDLNTAHVDLDDMAVAAANLLVARLGGDTSIPKTTVFPTEIVLRGTHSTS